MSRAWQALRALRLRLMGPAKELVGTDQFGNKYYRVPKHESRAGTHRGRAGGCGRARGDPCPAPLRGPSPAGGAAGPRLIKYYRGCAAAGRKVPHIGKHVRVYGALMTEKP